jgi:phosphoribosylformylglycinamidine synthase PurS subunit
MKFALKVLPKPEVLDTQGRAVQSTLTQQGFSLSDCHIGKYIVLEIPSDNPEEAQQMAKAMAEKGLYNPLIENYELEAL